MFDAGGTVVLNYGVLTLREILSGSARVAGADGPAARSPAVTLTASIPIPNTVNVAVEFTLVSSGSPDSWLFGILKLRNQNRRPRLQGSGITVVQGSLNL